MKSAVAVALYNGEKFIEKQLESIRNQSMAPNQVILCDDGSTDRTVEIVSDYIKKHELQEKWILVRNKENLGYIKNFYHAISLCDADVVFLSDQDDIWEKNKICKMYQIMEERKDIELLSCKYAIIDTQGKNIHSIIEKTAKQDYSLKSISVKNIMQAYRWPGMVMCIRKDFFSSIFPNIIDCPVPHDLIFTICAADRDSFFEYNYIGAYHRRHDNNLAREEHRIFKLLNLERKLKDIKELCISLQKLLDANLPLNKGARELIKHKLKQQKERQVALEERNLKAIINIYIDDAKFLLRGTSLICDVWLVLFGKYKKK